MIDITTSVPDAQITADGVELPDIADILAGQLSDLDAALGGGMQKDLRSPQGQIATSLTAIIAQNQARFAALINQINPDYSSGRLQDAIGRLYFMERLPGRGTVVAVTCTGLTGTVIPAGSLVQDNNGNTYASLAQTTIGEKGSALIDVQNTKFGPIPCPIGSINTIISTLPGWSDVENTGLGVLGNDVESRSAFEMRRRESVSINSRDVVSSVQAAVAAVKGVVDWYVWDNFSSETVEKGSTHYAILPHSLYVCVSGGNAQEIGNAIWRAKSGGCNVNGNITITVFDKNYEQPYPEYVIKYQEAIQTPVYVHVQLQNNPQLPGDITQQIQKTVIKAFTGSDGGSKARIGAYLNAGRFMGGIYQLDPLNMNIISIQVSLDNKTWTSFVELGIDQIPVITENNIKVTLV